MTFSFIDYELVQTKDFDLVEGIKSGEKNFTYFLCNNQVLINNILDACELSDDIDEYTPIPESETDDGKRPDILLEGVDNILATIECQNSAGWLDSIHASKSIYYYWAKDATFNILLCENSNEEMREYIRWLNKHPDIECFLVEYAIKRIGGSDKKIMYCNNDTIEIDGLPKGNLTTFCKQIIGGSRNDDIDKLNFGANNVNISMCNLEEKTLKKLYQDIDFKI